MKNIAKGFLLGVVTTILGVWIFQPSILLTQKAGSKEDELKTINNQTPQVAQDKTPSTEKADSVRKDFATNLEPSDSSIDILNKETEDLNLPKQRSKNLGNDEQRTNILIDANLSMAKNMLRGIVPRNSNIKDSFWLAVQEKIETDIELLNSRQASLKGLSLFDSEGNMNGNQLSAQQANEIEAQRIQQELEQEKAREQFEDSIKNLLSDSELAELRLRELEKANTMQRTILNSMTDGFYEGISDLNDYQSSEIERLMGSVPALTIDDVPIGSQLGLVLVQNPTQASNLERVTSEIHTLLSQEQLEAWREYHQNSIKPFLDESE